jgi:transcriptional regulator of acetoin/glycerol metabolism
MAFVATTRRRLGLSRATLHDKLKKYGIAGGEGEE